ncbi:hypothetical protein ABN028_16010 [Actinopolymorpha sp. B17G11]|uniref:hypothetical protein n=1 Tax=Actinopolymorpha sp. B17G11 TaxID=3160861 RepID=UPI0032E3842C
MSTHRTEVNTDELTALKLLAAGHSIGFTAAASGLSEDAIAAAVRRVDHRGMEALAEAAQALQEHLERALVDEPSDSGLERPDHKADRLATI